MQFSISTPGQLVFQTLPLQTATHIYTQVLLLKCRWKKAFLPLHLVLGANCCARTRVVRSYNVVFFFPREDKPFQWKKLESLSWSPSSSRSQQAAALLHVSSAPKAFVRLGAVIPIKDVKAFTSTAALSGSNQQSQDPWGQLKIPHVFTPLPCTQDTHNNKRLSS